MHEQLQPLLLFRSCRQVEEQTIGLSQVRSLRISHYTHDLVFLLLAALQRLSNRILPGPQSPRRGLRDYQYRSIRPRLRVGDVRPRTIGIASMAKNPGETTLNSNCRPCVSAATVSPVPKKEWLSGVTRASSTSSTPGNAATRASNAR